MGNDHRHIVQLAPVDLALLRAGRDVVRRTGRNAPDQFVFPFGQYRLGFLGVEENVGNDLAQRIRGRAFCVAPNPHRIRCMDF